MFGSPTPFSRRNSRQDDMDAAALGLYRAAKELVDSSWQHDDRDGRGPTDCVYGEDLEALQKAVEDAKWFAGDTD